MSSLKFPDGFLWGSATASYQVEGGIENCDWAKAGRDGKVPEAGLACDFKNKYKEDLKTAKDLVHNAFRFSIEWASVEPEEGKFDEDAIRFYLDLILEIKKNGMEPLMTLWHFTLPLWFVEKGGFEKKANISFFERYCMFVLGRLAGEVFFVTTINEPMVWVSNGYIRGNWPPFKHTTLKHFDMLKNLALAHNDIYKQAKEKWQHLSIGYAKDNIYFHAGNMWPWNILLSKYMNWFWNNRFINMTKGHFDHFGLNYYFHRQFGGKKQELPKNDFGWEIYPEGIYGLLSDLRQLNVPIYITENGLSGVADTQREHFIVDHLKNIHRAISEGVMVKGYFYWSLLDNFEWAVGYQQRFGLIEVDFDTQERKIRDSAFVYKDIIESNTIE